MTPSGIHPRSVTPGIENQTAVPDPESPPEKPSPLPPPGVHVRLDWMRFVGKETALDRLQALLLDTFGEPTSESSGAKWFRGGVNWHPGVTLSHGHGESIIQLDVRGERLAFLGTDAAIHLMRQVYALLGFYATRLDTAIDFVGQERRLHYRTVESCRLGELCRIRRYADDSEYTATGEPTRLLLKLGKRGSPVCGRVYDKGLQTKSAPAGVWERIEIEFKKDRAGTLAEMLLAPGVDWAPLLTNAVLGSVDFRVRNGRSEIARRPRAPWWADLLAGSDPKPIKPMSRGSDFNSWWEWSRGSFARRFLQVCGILQIPPEILILDLVRGLRPAETETSATIELRTRSRGSEVR